MTAVKGSAAPRNAEECPWMCLKNVRKTNFGTETDVLMVRSHHDEGHLDDKMVDYA